MSLQEADLKKMLACGVHIGSENLDRAHERYVYKRNSQGEPSFLSPPPSLCAQIICLEEIFL